MKERSSKETVTERLKKLRSGCNHHRGEGYQEDCVWCFKIYRDVPTQPKKEKKND